VHDFIEKGEAEFEIPPSLGVLLIGVIQAEFQIPPSQY
jgi:hypothetical protein